jgi:hypothetical protein
MLDVSIDEDDPRESLRRAFARLTAGRIDHVCLRFPAQVRANHHLAHDLRALIEATPSLRRVVLVHPSAAIGFVASSLSLWLPGVAVDGRQESPTTSEGTPPASVDALEIAVHAIPNTNGKEAILAAIEGAHTDGSPTLVLEFDASDRIDRTLLDAIIEAVQPGTRLRRIVLVHPSPGIGFLASGVALRCPSVRVLAAATAAEARRLLADSG